MKLKKHDSFFKSNYEFETGSVTSKMATKNHFSVLFGILPPFLANFLSIYCIIILISCTRAIMNEPKATDPRWYLTNRQKLVATGNFKSDLSLKNEQKLE